MFITADETVRLAEWIIDDTYLVSIISAHKSTQDWVEGNKWDNNVSLSAKNLLSLCHTHHALLLIVVIAYTSLHIFNSLLLIAGALLEKRLLFLPWLIQDLTTTVLVGLICIFWAFFSFFVHVLVAVFFPVVAGLILGFWIYMWRNVRELFIELGADALLQQHQGTVYRKLPAGSGTRSLLVAWSGKKFLTNKSQSPLL